MKVSKKIERLCRGIVTARLMAINFPTEQISERVDDAWPGAINQARVLNLCCNRVEDWELDGQTTQESIDRWSQEA